MTDASRFTPTEWAFSFHGHHCPFMPLGYRMGVLALEGVVGLPRDAVVAELGEGHPQTCLMDGIQAATGATFGKTLIEKTSWGKLAATFWHPGTTPVRYALRAGSSTSSGSRSSSPIASAGSSPRPFPPT